MSILLHFPQKIGGKNTKKDFFFFRSFRMFSRFFSDFVKSEEKKSKKSFEAKVKEF